MKRMALRTPLSKSLVALGAGAALLAALAWHCAAPAAASGRSPLGQLSRTAADLAPMTGRVVERIEVGSYTYLAVQPDNGAAPVWTVTLGDGQPVGARVRVRSLGRRTDFHSPRLRRTFPELTFGVVSAAP